MKPTHQTIALQLIASIFDGEPIRVVMEDGKPLFVAKDVFHAAGITAQRDAYRRLKDYERVSTGVDTLGGKQTMVCLTQSGVFHVLFASQKPAAEKLRCWLADEVLPQLIAYGSYIPNATEADRHLMKARACRQERAAMMAADAAFLAEFGLLPLQRFRVENQIPARDALPFSRRVLHMAKVFGVAPVKRFVKGAAKNPVNVWPRHILCAAANSIIPRLPFTP